MLRNALAAGLVLSPMALDFWVEPVLDLGERAGTALGALYAPESPRDSGPAQAAPLPPPSPEEQATPLDEAEVQRLEANSEAPSHDRTKPKKAKRPAATQRGGSKSALPTPKHGIAVGQASVLRLARARAVPSGQFVPASGARPAGLRLSGASALGIGVQDGDVLTHVSGVPVSDKGQVVNLVLQARARRATQITGRFYRGEEPWLLVVELPYPVPNDPPPSPVTP